MSEFGIIMLLVLGLVGIILLIEGLAAVSRFFEQGGFRTALDRLAYVNREPVYAPPYMPQKALPAPVQEPVPTDTNAVPAGSEAGTDTEPVPEITHRMDDISIIALLAVQKDDKGEYRFSANDIVELIGKRRNDTLKYVSGLRAKKKAPQPEQQYPEMTPEQAATRQQLALEK